MTPPYYQDKSVTLHHGDSLEILPALDLTADALLTDPPYFKVKQDEWDNQWDKAAEFLGWMGEWLDHAQPLLAPNASVWVFASPAMTSSVERLVGERFKVLNSIRWVKEAGWHQKASLPAMRRFLTPWEGIVFAEPHGADGSALMGSGWSAACAELHAGVFEPIRAYLLSERDRAGFTNKQVDAHLRTNGMAGHYFGASQWALPKPEVYEKLRELFNSGGGEFLRKDYEDLRRPFNITDRAVSTDVWTFPAVKPYKGKHPCEKPQPMLRHMIETSTRPGATILEPFAGSGSTLLAARALGRKTVAIEKDEAWCEKIATKLSEGTLPLEDAA